LVSQNRLLGLSGIYIPKALYTSATNFAFDCTFVF